MDTIIVVVTLMLFGSSIAAVWLYIKRKEFQSEILRLEVELQKMNQAAPSIVARAQEEAARLRRESDSYA